MEKLEEFGVSSHQMMAGDWGVMKKGDMGYLIWGYRMGMGL